MQQNTQSKIEEVIQQAAKDLGYTIYESSMLLKGEKSQIFVKIDQLTGISHNDCEKYSKLLCEKLDTENLLPKYIVEVSSPGLNRKLRNINEFTRFIGSNAKVVYETETSGIKNTVKGKINNVIDTIIQVESDKTIYKIDISKITKANLEY